MKKTIIFTALFIFVLALLPILGNKFVKEKLDTKIETLKANGIESKNSIEKLTYLNSSRHYEFVLSDMDKFLNYLSHYSDKQLSPHTSAMLMGTVIGVDLNYSNFPFSEAVSIDIYPLSFSDEIMKELERKDKIFFEYIENFLMQKGILYHINYNIATESFGGYIKDIDERQTMSNASELVVKLTKATFKGEGGFITPSSLQMNIDKIVINMIKANQNISIDLDKFSSTSIFNSKTTYLTSSKINSLSIDVDGIVNNSGSLKISDMDMNIVSNTEEKKAKFNLKSSFSKMFVESNKLNFIASNFNSDLKLFDLDKNSLEELRVLISKSKSGNSIYLNKEIRDSSIKLLSKGLKFDIKDFSIKNIKIDNDDLKGFKIDSKIILKEEMNLVKNIGYNPFYLSKNLDLDFNLKVSKKIFSKVSSTFPMTMFAYSYAKEDMDDLIFEIRFNNNKLSVNGKALGN